MPRPLLRPSRYTEFPERGFGYSLPVHIRFCSGYRQECAGIAIPFETGVGGTYGGTYISAELLERAGGAQSCHALITTGMLGGKSEKHVPIEIAVPRNNDELLSSTLAGVQDQLPVGADIMVSIDVLQSLGDVGITPNGMRLWYPKFEMFSLWRFDQLLRFAVLILGPDTGAQLKLLRFVEVVVNQTADLKGWILRDYHDVAGRDLHQKLFCMAGASKFVLVLDSLPSGHLVEIQALSVLPSPIGVLRPSGRGGSWMLDPLLERSNVRLFEYKETDDQQELFQATAAAIQWAQWTVAQKGEVLNTRYPWRTEEIQLANEVFPTYESMIKAELKANESLQQNNKGESTEKLPL